MTMDNSRVEVTPTPTVPKFREVELNDSCWLAGPAGPGDVEAGVEPVPVGAGAPDVVSAGGVPEPGELPWPGCEVPKVDDPLKDLEER